MTLQDAVRFAPKHNHDIRIASYTVEEKQHAKRIAKSSYLPPCETTAAFWHLTDTQLIEINAGNTTGRTPSQQFLQRHTGDVEPRVIKEIEVAIRPRCMQQLWERVDNLAKE
jgi:outer membrane protein TolC